MTDHDIEYIRKNYLIKTNKEIADHLGRSCNTIKNKRLSLGLPGSSSVIECQNCGEIFISNYSGKKFCSDICRRKHQYNDRAYSRRCSICGNQFISKSPHKQGCSEECFHKIMSGIVNSRWDPAEVKSNKAKWRKRASDNERENISNKYVKLILYKQTGIKMSQITNTDLIELKRSQLRLRREIKKSKEEISNVTD